MRFPGNTRSFNRPEKDLDRLGPEPAGLNILQRCNKHFLSRQSDSVSLRRAIQKEGRGPGGCAGGDVYVFLCWRLRVCVRVCVCVQSMCVRENLYLHFLNLVCVRACNEEGTSHTSSRVDGRLE